MSSQQCHREYSQVYVVTDNICNPNRYIQSQPMKKQTSHPKQQSFLASRRKTPLQDMQQAQQFMRSYLNVYNTIQSPPLAASHNNSISYPLAFHLIRVPSIKQYSQTSQAQRQKQKLSQQASHGMDNTLTKEDEESEYQNYLKEYETVVKNSRKKDFISPVSQKEQMDELITEFLSGMQGQSRISQKKKHPVQTVEKKKQKNSKDNSQQQISIRVQKIDLSDLKPKAGKKSAAKDREPRTNRKETTPIKQINLQKYMTAEVKSPRFANRKQQKLSKRQSPKKQSHNKTIELIKVEDLRGKNSRSRVAPGIQTKQKTQKPNQSTNENDYTYAKSTVQKDSYLKKNIHKTIKNQKHNQIVAQSRTKNQESGSVSQAEPETHSKKPIKIEIQIPLEEYQLTSSFERVQQYDVESRLQLHQEETQIIRQISQKVLSLIQKTKHLTPQKNQ